MGCNWAAPSRCEPDYLIRLAGFMRTDPDRDLSVRALEKIEQLLGVWFKSASTFARSFFELDALPPIFFTSLPVPLLPSYL
jgi:hypothetical protein